MRIFLASVASILAVAGCSSDTAEHDQGESTQAPGSAGTDGGNDGAGQDDDGTGAAGTGLTGVDESGGGDSGDPTGPPMSSDAACPLDCGNGVCTVDELGTFGCACPDDEAEAGATCLPCVQTPGPVDAPIGVALVTVLAKFDHEDAPSSILEDGNLVLVDRQRGDEARLGNSHDGTLQASVVPGDYELHWRFESGGSVVPRNSNASLGVLRVLDDGTIVLPKGSPLTVDDLGVLTVDIPTVHLTGTFTFNGGDAPLSPLDNGRVRLLDPATGDEVVLGQTNAQTFDVRVVPGTYEVHYERIQSSVAAPRNHDAWLTTTEIVAGPEGDASLTVDVGVTTISGDFLVDAAPAPTSPFDRGRIALRDPLTGDEIDLGFTNDSSFQVPVVPGDYEVVYRWVQGSVLVPRNEAAIVETLAVPPGDATLDIDIPTMTLAGNFTVDGGTPPTDPANVGELSLRSVDSDDEIVLGETVDGNYSALVIPAQYEIYYRQKTSSGLVPANTNAWLGTVDLTTGAVPGDIDVPYAPVAGAVLLNGATPPTSEYDDGRIYLRNAQTDDSVLLGSTRLGSVASLVVPGTYDVYYAVESAGAVVPQNSQAYLTTVQVVDGVPLDLPLDISTLTMAGTITVAGVAPPGGDTDRAILYLEDRATDDVIHLGEIASGSFALPLTAGSYVLYYEMLQTTGQVPGNQRAAIACYTLGTF